MCGKSGKSSQTKIDNIYIISMIKKIATIILGLLVTILITRYLGPTKKGIYAVVTNYVRIVVTVAMLGQTVIYPYILKSKSELRNVQITGVIIMIIVEAIVCFSFLVLKRKLVSVVELSVFLFPFQILQEYISGVMLVENYQKYSITSIISNIIQIVFCSFLFLFTKSNVLLILFTFIVRYIYIIIVCWKDIACYINLKKFSIKKYINCLNMGIIPMFTALLGVINYQIDVIMLQWLHIPYNEIGLYSTAVMVSETVCMLPDAFKEAIASKNTKEDCKNDVVLLSKISLFIAILLIVAFGIVGKIVLNIAFGMEYVGAYQVVIILLFGNIPMIYFKIIGIYYQTNGRFISQFIILSVSAILNIVLNIILIPKLSIIGAGIASVGSYMIAGGIYMMLMCVEYHVNFKEFILVKKRDLTYLKSIKNKLLKRK